MEMIAMIMSGLALLAATGCLVLIARNEKRSEEQRAAMVNYADVAASEAEKKCLERFHEILEKREDAFCKQLDKEFFGMNKRIRDLEQGITPDYEQAKAAANAVNDFSKGLTNILGFDPMEALQAERQMKESGDFQ